MFLRLFVTTWRSVLTLEHNMKTYQYTDQYLQYKQKQHYARSLMLISKVEISKQTSWI
jgi:hypothetical protein